MLEKLKEYKELIAIIVFFLGGFFWLQSEFPSKNDLKSQLKVINCQLDSYMQLTQLQISSQEQEKQLNDLLKKLSEAPPDDNSKKGVSISPAMRVELEQLRVDYTERRNQLGVTTAAMAKIKDELARGVCEKGEL